ncbi:hypothetical protein A3F57_03195 [Candidatus Roizmanbacteria bacterium RIFCSPHIGHO2_12_FULL_36_11]|uniref:HTH cro/C1-type domain-containing protein n=1 Tax=Candidatus Curtissbacteria bacterium RIFCSPLOWO2_01_FULL_37_9 TaxID=1797724 RepID=A0A1F5GUI9_9BACT|nr:MAG: hypothetical protein A3A48_03690 [Candidatus Curtissbacteria bacterium RIFCSPLOWO2_01_FULL_37_9]OGK32568.1 MAG: hypothetical protein A3F57_03195 [Candidatus Roizmanbacteria bacterium RIFCSPHIGHO2_12_FULL_36_11]
MRYRICEQLGAKIKRVRKKAKISQEKLAEQAKMHASTLGRIERGESNPPVYTVYKIVKALKVSLPEIFSFR